MQPFKIFSLVLLWLLSPSSGAIIHSFSLGKIKGTTMYSRNSNKFYAFMGIPYAKPPIGELRFQNPDTDLEPWDHLYDATKEAEPCAQGGASGAEFKGDEDCLYLNLYTPKLPNDTSSKLPVWFFLFPGRHLFGDAHVAHYGPQYIMDHPVIFITAAYRLGPFGFLSTEDDVIPGNFGLKDQSAVLLWIKKYISEFGGDPDRVTIAGESSSSQDVCLHLTSPLSRDLFHRGISESGHCLNYRAVAPPGAGRMQAWKLGRILGCTSSYIRTSEDLLECISSYSTMEISSSLFFMMHDYILPHTFFGIVLESPDSEGAFLISHPVYEITKPTNKTWLLGIVTDEGQQKALAIFGFPAKDKKVRQAVTNHYARNMKTLIPYLFGFDYSENSAAVFEAVRNRYFGDKPFNQSFQGFAKAFGLSSIQTGMMEAALKFPGTKYFYHYDHLNNPGYEKMYMVRFKFITKEKLGVVHGEELRSLIYQPMVFQPTLEGEDRIISDHVVELWANFVAYGNPNGMKKKQIWKPVTSSNIEHLYIGNGSITPRTRPFWDDYNFFKKWDMPQLMTVDRIRNSEFAHKQDV